MRPDPRRRPARRRLRAATRPGRCCRRSRARARAHGSSLAAAAAAARGRASGAAAHGRDGSARRCACDGCDHRAGDGRRRRRRASATVRAGTVAADRLPSAPRDPRLTTRAALEPLSSAASRIDLSPRPFGSGKWTRSGVPGDAAHRDRAERAQAVDDRLHQHFGRRRAGREADAALAFEPLGPQVVGAVDHVGVGAEPLGELAQAVAVRAARAADDDQHVDAGRHAP